MNRKQPNGYRFIGRSTPKVDAVDKLTGTARFSADVKVPRTSIGKVLRSPHAHARIRAIDTTRAEKHPGVAAVVSGRDFPDIAVGSPAAYGTVTARERYLSHEAIARDKVLFNGHAVAAVAATSAEIAEEALGLIEVDYEVLPHVLDSEQAASPEAVLLHEDLHTRSDEGSSQASSNVAEHLVMGRGDVESGFAGADVVVGRTFRTQVVHQGYVEPDTETADVRPDGSVTVWSSTQGAHMVRHDLAVVLDIPLSKIRVVPTEVGGAFGGKESIRTSALCVALSRKAGTPVRIALTREEVLKATGSGNSLVAEVKVGARHDGEITAIQARLVYDAGAFPGAPLRSAVRRIFSHYRTPNLRVDAYDVVTNKPRVAAYRAPGATPTNFALESVVDEIGEALDIDPIELRLKNVSRTGDPMPDGVRLSSVSLSEILDRVKGHPCWTEPLDGPNRGRGLAVGMWTMPGGTTSCHITLSGDGSVTLVLGTVDLSATRTSLAMVTAELMGLDLEDVRVVIGDTDMVAYSDASAGDKVTYVTSKAVQAAVADLLEKLKERAAKELGASVAHVVYDRKRFWVEGIPEMEIGLGDLALRCIRGGGGVVMGYGSASEASGDVALAPNATVHVADVEVDPETGKVQVLRYTAFQDVGLAIDPDQVEGQIQGGAVQGIGWALSEEYVYDEDGRLTNPTLLDYRLQTSLDLPFIDAQIVEVPSDDHPLGLRAVGQVPIVAPAAAIANAIYRASGVRVRELPMSPERVYKAIAGPRE